MAVMTEENYLAHYGILRKSGRYPWGSGGTQSKRNKMFLDTIADLRKQGLSDVEICKGFSTDEHPFTTSHLRAALTIAKSEQKQSQINMAQRLQDKGLSNVAIGERMGLNESSVRALLAPGRKDKEAQLNSIAEMLRRQVDEKGYLDVGVGVERSLPLGESSASTIGVPKDKFQTAVAILKEEGYATHTVKLPQLGTREKTTFKVLVKPGVTQADVWANRFNIRQITEQSKDNGRTMLGIQPPLSISSKRVAIRYGEDGGAHNDGVLFVRPGVKDVSIGASRYAQVRVAVDDTHYIKGMAVYKNDLPDGVDIVFNTNKKRGTPMKSVDDKADQVLKPLKKDADGNVDMDNPFGAVIKAGGQILEQRGNKTVVTSSMNILREEGDWDKYSKSLSSQMLSKQRPELIKQQLDFTHERRLREYQTIMSLTNPAVRKKLLESFADGTDSAAIDLKAAGLPNQASKVLMPVPSMKPHEVYAPSYRDGTQLALIRFPHGGTFEIPILTVNNKNREARALLGSNAVDAIGIHHKVAEHLSGADFDGDHVIAIPNDRGSVKATPPLEGLKGFDPRHSYPKYEGMIPIDAVKGRDQVEMGKITNLIADMTLRGANEQELARAVRHSMVVIDAKKHELDYRQSATDNNIAQLKAKYQGSARSGASTLITRATSEARPLERRLRKASEGGPIDPVTGKLVFVETGATTTDRKGNVIPKRMRSVKLRETEDAHTLSSGYPSENLYADHSNRLKALANQARRDYVNTPPLKQNPSSKQTYSAEVASLNVKLDNALKNAPLERQAQALANAVVSQKRKAYPEMEPEDLRKIKFQALAEMRVRTGAKKQRIDITQEEWNAIQAGAISNTQLNHILNNTDIEEIKKLATPHEPVLMSSTATSRAKNMLSSGYTQAEVAEALGMSVTTLKAGLSEG